MKLLSAEFVTSAALRLAPDEREGLAQGRPGKMAGIPSDGLPQIALAGRSNVGKSSLLNALCGRPIARTSGAPGKTRLVNVYRAQLDGGPGGPGRWSVYLVDLPGYGYARGGTQAAEALRAASEAYFGAATPGPGPGRGDGLPAGVQRDPASTKESRRAVLLLVDARHPGLESDLAAAAWLDRLGIARRVVATKIDKLTRAERTRNLRELERTYGMSALPVSAASGEGLDELWQTIANLVRR